MHSGWIPILANTGGTAFSCAAASLTICEDALCPQPDPTSSSLQTGYDPLQVMLGKKKAIIGFVLCHFVNKPAALGDAI